MADDSPSRAAKKRSNVAHGSLESPPHPPTEPAPCELSPVRNVRRKQYIGDGAAVPTEKTPRSSTRQDCPETPSRHLASACTGNPSPQVSSEHGSPNVHDVRSSVQRTVPAQEPSSARRSASKGQSTPRDRSTGRSTDRTGSVGRRPGAGHVRELFRIQTQLNNIGYDEQLAREDVAAQEGLYFARIFQSSLLTRLVSSEGFQRGIQLKEEDSAFQLLRKRYTNASAALLLDQQRENESVAIPEVVTGDNRLYDRMLRKRQQLGLNKDVEATIGGESTKHRQVAMQGKQASEEDVAKMRAEVGQLEAVLSQEESTVPTMSRKDRRSMEQERRRKEERLQKLREMIEHHEQYEDAERKRADRAVHLKGVDRDVLTGKKTVMTSKREKEIERQKVQYEEEVEMALRRALQNERKEAPASNSARLNSTVTKLPSISKSAEPPSVSEPTLKPRKRRMSSVSAS